MTDCYMKPTNKPEYEMPRTEPDFTSGNIIELLNTKYDQLISRFSRWFIEKPIINEESDLKQVYENYSKVVKKIATYELAMKYKFFVTAVVNIFIILTTLNTQSEFYDSSNVSDDVYLELAETIDIFSTKLVSNNKETISNAFSDISYKIFGVSNLKSYIDRFLTPSFNQHDSDGFYIVPDNSMFTETHLIVSICKFATSAEKKDEVIKKSDFKPFLSLFYPWVIAVLTMIVAVLIANSISH